MVDCKLKKNWDNLICRRKVGEGQFSIIIPKNDNLGRPIKPQKIQSYIKKVNNIFGGSTTLPVTKGCYVKDDKFFCEEGIKITGNRDFNGKYTSDSFKNMSPSQRSAQLEMDYKKLKKIAKDSAKDLGQDSIMVVYDNIADVSFVGDDYADKVDNKLIGDKKIFDYKEN